MVTDTAPMSQRYWKYLPSWELFDHDRTTSVELKKSEVVTNPDDRFTYWGESTVSWDPMLPFAFRPTHYRIVLPADLDPADAPTSWSVWVLERDVDGSGDFNSFEGKVTNAVFRNRVYQAALPVVTDLRIFYFQLWDDSARIAEIELLGPRKSLNALWPYGDYPCDQRLQVLTSLNGPEKVFSKSGNKVTQNQRREAFRLKSFADGGSLTAAVFKYDGHKPVLVGAELPDGPMVQEVIIHASWPKSGGLKKVVLQGNFCSPKCDRFGSKGWVRLSVSKLRDYEHPDFIPGAVRLCVKNPDVYKAYRLKLVPLRNKKNPSTYVQNVLFLGCKA